MDLATAWFALVGVLLAGYAILDGFDLGVGILHPFHRGDQPRRIALNAIGPVWDGNEVWLVTGGGALFAAFPEVYATIFSGFYLPLMLLLMALIMRAVAIEFRSKQISHRWRSTWDWVFAIGSFLIALLAGVAFGNVLQGLPLTADHELDISLFALLTPFPLLVGITTVTLFALHGAIYLVLKTEGEIQEKVRSWIQPALITFILCFAILTIATLVFRPQLAAPLRENPVLFLFPLLTLLALANIPRCIHHGREGQAFLSSSAVIAGLFATAAAGLYPNIVPAIDPANSLHIGNAASSPKTLQIMFIIALIGMPVVIAYTICIYWIYRGKVKLDATSY
ncbi:cytochrome D oxidase subunit I [Planctomycetota bacterium]|nr:cytochrome D oxidase subunit I [Planctomycetota bacterium]